MGAVYATVSDIQAIGRATAFTFSQYIANY